MSVDENQNVFLNQGAERLPIVTPTNMSPANFQNLVCAVKLSADTLQTASANNGETPKNEIDQQKYKDPQGPNKFNLLLLFILLLFLVTGVKGKDNIIYLYNLITHPNVILVL